MAQLTDSSEFQAAIRIAKELAAQSALAPAGTSMGHRKLKVYARPPASLVAGPSQDQVRAVASEGAAVLREPTPDATASILKTPVEKAPAQIMRPAAPAPAQGEEGFRGDRLENALREMCERGGFIGALIVDDDGLPLAVFNSPVREGAIGAFAMVLGAALDKSGKLLDQHEASNISIDINYTDKIVLRRFLVGETPAYLLVICPQEADERSEVELSIDQITGILHRG